VTVVSPAIAASAACSWSPALCARKCRDYTPDKQIPSRQIVSRIVSPKLHLDSTLSGRSRRIKMQDQSNGNEVEVSVQEGTGVCIKVTIPTRFDGIGEIAAIKARSVERHTH
jgi:hypothetical protein